jgi:hypothetical protein
VTLELIMKQKYSILSPGPAPFQLLSARNKSDKGPRIATYRGQLARASLAPFLRMSTS